VNRFVALAAVTLAGAAACALVGGNGDALESSVVAGDDASAVDAGGPRRVCPSARDKDGSWVVVDGIDVSDYQFTNWDEVAAKSPNVKFGIVRISAGLVRVDSRFTYDWAGMKRAGLIRGVYQYFKPSQSAIAQADLYLERLNEEGGLEPNDLPPVLDFETTNDMPPETVSCRIKLWLARVERATKRLPLIYSSNQQKEFLTKEFARYPLWVPNYVKTPSKTCPVTPDTWDMWTFWQHSDKGFVSGVYDNGDRNGPDGGSMATWNGDGGDGGPKYSGSDVNYFDGTLADLQRFIGKGVSTTPVVDPPLPVNPPHVPGASQDAGAPIDCADGCCVAGP
jgi:lysozyme